MRVVAGIFVVAVVLQLQSNFICQKLINELLSTFRVVFYEQFNIPLRNQFQRLQAFVDVAPFVEQSKGVEGIRLLANLSTEHVEVVSVLLLLLSHSFELLKNTLCKKHESVSKRKSVEKLVRS